MRVWVWGGGSFYPATGSKKAHVGKSLGSAVSVHCVCMGQIGLFAVEASMVSSSPSIGHPISDVCVGVCVCAWSWYTTHVKIAVLSPILYTFVTHTPNNRIYNMQIHVYNLDTQQAIPIDLPSNVPYDPSLILHTVGTSTTKPSYFNRRFMKPPIQCWTGASAAGVLHFF